MRQGLPQLREQPGPGGLFGISQWLPPAHRDSQRRLLGGQGPWVRLGPGSQESFLTKLPSSAKHPAGEAQGGVPFGVGFWARSLSQPFKQRVCQAARDSV